MFQGLECSLSRLNLDGTALPATDLFALGELRYSDQLHVIANAINNIPEGALKKKT